MNSTYGQQGQPDEQNSNKESIDKPNEYQSINDFRGNVERSIVYDEARRSMLIFYHGTRDEEWFLDELIKCFDQLVSYETGIQFISEINNRIIENFPPWTEAIFSYYTRILKFKIGINLLCDNLRRRKNSKQATLHIEDVFSNFEELKTSQNYFEFFNEILKIYKGDENVKEILNSFDWTTDQNSFNYLSSFSRFFSVADIQFLVPYIEDPLKFTDNENDSNVLNLVLTSANEEIAEQLIDKLIPGLPSFFNQDFLMQIVLTIIDRANSEQCFSIYTAFDIALYKKNVLYAANFDLAVLRAVESMNWQRRFEFFSSHFTYFKNSKSNRIINLLKTMELNEKNYQKTV